MSDSATTRMREPTHQPLLREIPLPAGEAGTDATQLELSVVMPCLNEAETLAACVEKAMKTIADNGIAGEVIVADNGSTDGSIEIAERLGARVVNVTSKGYGNALMGGISAAYGKFIVMGDADESYDFGEIPRFMEKLRAGADVVQGCRLPGGGGKVMPGAMPALHYWWGNPMFSFLAKRLFHAPINDIYCGLRGFSKSYYVSLDQRCTGMEFATEMIIKSSLSGAKIAEVPITLHPDGRKTRKPHLKTFRDGWRTLRFFMLCSPRWLFLIPGMLAIAAGVLGYALALPSTTIHGVTFGAHTLLFSSLFILIGYQAILFAVAAKTFAISERILPEDPKFSRLFELVNLEKGLLLGVGALLIGAAMMGVAVNQWRVAGFGPLDYARTMRWVVPGVLLAGLGSQTLLWAFFISIMGMRRK